MMDNLYEMKLHEELTIGWIKILRVPGGWIYVEYQQTHNTDDTKHTSVFVPFHNEFQL